MAHEFETLDQAARALLIETCGLLDEKRIGYVIAGGWVPVLRGTGPDLVHPGTRDVDVLFIAYGTVARICKSAIALLAEHGVTAGLFRPITLFPYPGEVLAQAAERAKHLLVTELSTGQMIEDARYHLGKHRPVHFYGRVGGMIMAPEELVTKALTLVGRQV